MTKRIVLLLFLAFLLAGCATYTPRDIYLPGRFGQLTIKIRNQEGVNHACISAGVRTYQGWQIKGCTVGELDAPTIIVTEDFWTLLHEFEHLNNPKATENEVRERINDPRYPPIGDKR